MAKKILKNPVSSMFRRGAALNPNVHTVQYVNIAGLRDIGKRNQECPCGSGVKYKKCCRLKKREAPKAHVNELAKEITDSAPVKEIEGFMTEQE